jgi:hypothetical protein
LDVGGGRDITESVVLDIGGGSFQLSSLQLASSFQLSSCAPDGPDGGTSGDVRFGGDIRLAKGNFGLAALGAAWAKILGVKAGRY